MLGVALAFALSLARRRADRLPAAHADQGADAVLFLVGLDVLFSLILPNDGVAHLAHVGGAAFGYLFFRLQALLAAEPASAAPRRRARGDGAVGRRRARAPDAAVTPLRPRRRADADPVAAEVDRVLDKISEKGIASLTPAERRFLDEVSKQKKQEH